MKLDLPPERLKELKRKADILAFWTIIVIVVIIILIIVINNL